MDEVRALRHLRGDDLSAINKHLEQGIKRREPGKYRGVSTRHLEEVLERSKRLGYRDEGNSYPQRDRLPGPRGELQMVEVNGFVKSGLEPVRDAFAANFEEGVERGASVAVTRDGEFVVDLWAGESESSGRLWEEVHHRQRLLDDEDDGERGRRAWDRLLRASQPRRLAISRCTTASTSAIAKGLATRGTPSGIPRSPASA